VAAYFMSLREFVWATFKRWWVLLFGVGFAVIGALGALGVSVTVPTPVAFGVSAGTWFVAAGLAYHDLRIQRAAPSGTWLHLEPVMQEGAELLRRSQENEMEGWNEDAAAWETRAARAIGQWTDTTEVALFREAGRGEAKWPDELVRAKVKFMRDGIHPKAREGYWQ
jgi:hypothetical protein